MVLAFPGVTKHTSNQHLGSEKSSHAFYQDSCRTKHDLGQILVKIAFFYEHWVSFLWGLVVLTDCTEGRKLPVLPIVMDELYEFILGSQCRRH
jgi:hypothetical protein